MEAPSYYACRVQLNGDTALVVWYSANRDGFLGDAGGQLGLARTLEALSEAARARGGAL